MLRVINHRPRQESQAVPILGACVEINTPAADILCDAGVFFPADREFANVLAPKSRWRPGIDCPLLSARHYAGLLSHGHTDHYAGLFALNPETEADVYAGELTWRILNDTANRLKVKPERNLRYAGTFTRSQPFHIAGCRITPITVKHDIPDCWAFVIDCGTRLLYAPEFMEPFWEEADIGEIDIAVIGYMPDFAPGKDCSLPNKIDPPNRDCLIFYVTPGENLESTESAFKYFAGRTFISPYVKQFFSLLPDTMKEDFPTLSQSATFDQNRPTAGPALVACHYGDIARYLENAAQSAKNLHIISNDYCLSRLARNVKAKPPQSRLARTIARLKSEGHFTDIFRSSHGSKELVRELLAHLLRSREKIKVMVTHATEHASLKEAFGEKIEIVNEFSAPPSPSSSRPR